MKTLKKLMALILSTIMIFSSMSVLSYAAVDTKNEQVVEDSETLKIGEITRDEYVKILARSRNISIEEADRLERIESSVGTLAYDEVQKYKNVEKTAYTIKGGNGYTQKVSMVVTVRYIYNKALKKAVTIEKVTAPYAYMPGINLDNFTFDHGDYAIEMKGSSSAWIYTNGSFTYTTSGVTVTVGNDIVSASGTIIRFRVVTKAVRIGMRVYLSDL